MKKILLAACAIAAATTFQAKAQEGFHAGLTTGFYNTWIMDKGLFDSPTYDHQSTWRAHPIGLALGYQWETGAGIQLEVIKARIGQEMDIRTLTGPGGDFKVTGKKEINLNYVQVPLLFKLQAGEGKARFSFMIGPQISFLSKGEDIETFTEPAIIYTGTNNQVVPVSTTNQYIIGSTEANKGLYEFNKTAIGGVLGLGVDVFVHENVYLSGNLRVGYDFTEVRDESGGGKFVDSPSNTLGAVNDEARLYNRELRNNLYGGFQLGVHYLFSR